MDVRGHKGRTAPPHWYGAKAKPRLPETRIEVNERHEYADIGATVPSWDSLP